MVDERRYVELFRQQFVILPLKLEGEFEEAMAETRIDLAIEAGAKALHESARERRHFTWEQSSEESRRDLRAFVRPIVEAALESSDEYLAAATSKRHASKEK
ncbi:hypothetical protein [Bosea beijingensis]